LAGGINLYSYAGSNPLSFDDPFGLCDPAKDTGCPLIEAVAAKLAPWVPILKSGTAAVLTLASTPADAGAPMFLKLARPGSGAAIRGAVGAAVEAAGQVTGAGNKIFTAGRVVGEQGLTQSGATRAVQQAVTKLGFEQGPTLTQNGVNYVLGAQARGGVVNAIGVHADGTTTRAFFKLGEKGYELIQDIGKIPVLP
jgi:hypothetical protein